MNIFGSWRQRLTIFQPDDVGRRVAKSFTSDAKSFTNVSSIMCWSYFCFTGEMRWNKIFIVVILRIWKMIKKIVIYYKCFVQFSFLPFSSHKSLRIKMTILLLFPWSLLKILLEELELVQSALDLISSKASGNDVGLCCIKVQWSLLKSIFCWLSYMSSEK